MKNEQPFKPRNGRTLVVGIVARISGCQNQKEVSLDDQVDHAKDVVNCLWSGETEYRIISTKGKGEHLDRPELVDVETMLRSKELDMLVVEDIGRMVRGVEASRLCGIAVDHGTRVLSPNDNIDTNDDGWEADVISACREHVGHNAHTSKRLKHKLMNRFLKFGGATALPIFGYIVPDDAKTYEDWRKNDSATSVFSQWFKMLEAHLNWTIVADWLNENEVPTGPYCRLKKWNGAMVRRVTQNPLIKGMPQRGKTHTVKHNESGRRKSVKNPNRPKVRVFPHLEHVPPADFDRVNAMMVVANSNRGRKPVNGRDPRAGVPRKRTIWPGQHIDCGLCNRICYWGAHGQTAHLGCSGCRIYRCWNGASFDGHDAGRRIFSAVISALEDLPEFDAELVERLDARKKLHRSNRDNDLARVDSELSKVAASIERVTKAIETAGDIDVLVASLSELTTRKAHLLNEQVRIVRRDDRDCALPSVEKIREAAHKSIDGLAATSAEFALAMRRLIPRISIFPYRSCDGGAVVLRAHFALNLVSFTDIEPEVAQVLHRKMQVDLFDPPQRVAFRAQVVQLIGEGNTQRKVAALLGITQPAVQRALALDQLMRDRGLIDPYIPVLSPPDDLPKMRRHKHPRYSFERIDPA